jgi:hypothetical protein
MPCTIRAIRRWSLIWELSDVPLPGRRSVKKDAQAAWLLRAITCIDLTTLAATTPKAACAAVRQGSTAGAPGFA